MADENQDWRALMTHRLSRRTVLRAGVLGAAGLTAAALIGCGDDDDDDDDDAATPTATATATPTQAPAGDDDGAGAMFFRPGDAEFSNTALLSTNDPNIPFPFVPEEKNDPPKRGGRAQIARVYSNASLDVTKSSSGSTLQVPNSVSDRLLQWQHGANLHPFRVDEGQIGGQLAESWELAPDGLTYTFNLVQNAKYHNKPPANGRPFTSQDVKLVFERSAAEGISTAQFSQVAGFNAVEDFVFQFEMMSPQPDFLIAFAGRELPLYAIEMVDDGSIDTDIIGTGAYILTDLQGAESISFDKNPDYWGPEPFLDGHDWRVNTDSAARLAAFRAGQFDFLGSSPVSNVDAANSLLGTNPDTVIWTTPVLFGIFSIGVNHDNPKWADERIRQGLSISIDRDEVANNLWGATGVAKVLGLPWIFLYDSPPTPAQLGPWFDFKPEEGMKLLAAAGAEDFEFDVVYFNYNDSILPQDEIIQAQLRKVGVTMNLNALDITTYNSQLQTASYEDAIDGFATGGATATTFYRDHLKPGAGLNRWNINDPMLTQWGEDQATELDPDARKEILQKIWDRETQFLFKGIPKASRLGFNAKNPRLRNFRVGGPLTNVTGLGDEGTYMSDAWLDV